MAEVKRHPELWDKLVWQSANMDKSHRSTGLVLWRDKLVEVFDLSDISVAEWFLETCQEWDLYKTTDYITVTGGYASLLPAAADLNVSSENGNFYTNRYAGLVGRLNSSVIVSSGFQSQSEPLYTSVLATCDNINSIIPTALSLGVLGYVHLALDIQLSVNHSCSVPALRLLLELSMFFPVAKIPLENFLAMEDENGTIHTSPVFRLFEKTVRTFSQIRNNFTLPHYQKSMEEFLVDKTPLIRPMWWSEGERLGDQSRETTLNIGNQFMIGSDMVVLTFLHHPVVDNRIYLPAGLWYDPLWNGGTVNVTSGQYIIYASNSPVACFVRHNSLRSSSFP